SHAISLPYEPSEPDTSVVPPTATTHGDDAGKLTSGTPAGTPLTPTATGQNPPVSPDDVNTVWPWAAACMNELSSTAIDPASDAANSHSPNDALAARTTFCAANLLNATLMSASSSEGAS